MCELKTAEAQASAAGVGLSADKAVGAVVGVEAWEMKMRVLGILLLILSVVFCIVAVNTTPVPVLIKHGVQNLHEIIQSRIFYSALSGICLLAGIVLTAVGIAMEKIMKQNQEILSTVKQLAALAVDKRLGVDRRKVDRRQHSVHVAEERRAHDRRFSADRRAGG